MLSRFLGQKKKKRQGLPDVVLAANKNGSSMMSGGSAWLRPNDHDFCLLLSPGLPVWA
jgi:hypothetical protein